VNEPGDAHEREAERVAEQATQPEVGPPALISVRGASGVQRACRGCAAAMTAASAGRDAPAPGTGSAGRPLDPDTRAYFGSRLGRGFGGVRVHTDARADESARALDAHAYTQGSHVVFARGRYEPGTADGRRLLAHELAHVVQQGADGDAPVEGAGVVQRQPAAASAPAPFRDVPDRRPLSPQQNAFVDAFDEERIRFSTIAAGKMVELMRDIITGDPELLRSEWAPVNNEKTRVRNAVVKHLRIQSLFRTKKPGDLLSTERPVTWNWLGDPAAREALDVITRATNLVIAQAQLRLPRVYMPNRPPNEFARKLLGENVLGFPDRFFDPNEYKTKLCWTWVLLHENFHSLGIYHGVTVQGHSLGGPAETAVGDVDVLSALVLELSEHPVTVDCHGFGV
jgi:hypothetical protein